MTQPTSKRLVTEDKQATALADKETPAGAQTKADAAQAAAISAAATDATSKVGTEVTRATTAEGALRNLSDSAFSTALSTSISADMLNPASTIGLAQVGAIEQGRNAITPPMFRDPTTIISRFQSGHGFVYAPSGASGDDTSVFMFGNQSARLTTLGAGVTITLRKTVTAMDLTAKSFRVWVKVDDPTRVNLIGIRLGTDSSNYYRITSASPIPILETGWRAYTFTRADFNSTTGTPNWNNIAWVSLEAADKSTGALNVWFGGIEVTDAPATFPNGVITLDWDDNYASMWQYAKPEMDKRGMRGGVYAICETVDSGATYMTLDQLKQLQIAGWAIMSHSYYAATHSATFTGLAIGDVDADLAKCRAWLRTNGFRDSAFLAYPGGQNNAAVRALSDKYFTVSRTTASFPRQEYPPVNPQRLSGYPVRNDSTVAQMSAYIDAVKANGLAGHLIFHRVEDVSAGAAVNAIAIAKPDLISVLDYIQAQGVPVRTMREIYGPHA